MNAGVAEHFDLDDYGYPMEDVELLSPNCKAYLYRCNTCAALTDRPHAHADWHEERLHTQQTEG